ncbi:MAG: aspartic peptidase domain-containing protein [Podila humilis]|nr:MAG: aspartic peptidase domain-containing protein [Podila humilis]
MAWLCLLFTPTSFASTIPPYTLTRQQVSSPPFTDLAHLLEHPTQLRLDRTPYSSQYHARKPYLLTEPDAEYANTFDTLPSPPCSTITPLPKVPVSLTSIPKDYGYTATFSIGNYPSSSSSSSSSQSGFNLLIDTGSDLTVVTSAACAHPECLQVPHRFACAASTTCTATTNHLDGSDRWVQGYGDGTRANGTLVRDTVRFVDDRGGAAIELAGQPMLVVDQPGLGLFKSYGENVDGIVGLNLGGPVVSPTVLQNLQRLEMSWSKGGNNILANDGEGRGGMGLMSLSLNKSLAPREGGELLLNGIDTSRFKGSIYWSDCGPSPFDWTVLLDQGMMVDTQASLRQDVVPGTERQFAVIDSGSDGIYLQRDTYNELFKRIPGATQMASGYWRVPCQGDTVLVLGIQGRRYRISYHDWVKKPKVDSSTTTTTTTAGEPMCQAKVYGSSPGPILLGATFLRTVYTVFDFSHPGYERIGFADLA